MHKTLCIPENKEMKQTKKNVILTHIQEDNRWPYCQLLSKETGREFHVESVSTGNGGNRLRCLLNYVFFPLQLFFRRYRYDCIIAHQQFYGLFLAFYCQLFHVRKNFHLIILTFIYLEKKGFLGKIYYKLMHVIVQSKYIDAFIVHSTAEVKSYSSTFDVNSNRFYFVPLGINEIEVRHAIDELSKRQFILAVGRSNRDYDFLVNSLKNTDFQLEIICDNYHYKSVPENIHIHNNIFDDMPLWMHNCYCVVIPLNNPDISSGQLVLLQAFQMGKPVIATRGAAINDYIQDGVNGITIEKTREALLEALHRLYTQQSLYDQLSENERNEYIEKYSAEGQVRQTAQIIKEVTQCKNG